MKRLFTLVALLLATAVPALADTEPCTPFEVSQSSLTAGHLLDAQDYLAAYYALQDAAEHDMACADHFTGQPGHARGFALGGAAHDMFGMFSAISASGLDSDPEWRFRETEALDTARRLAKKSLSTNISPYGRHVMRDLLNIMAKY